LSVTSFQFIPSEAGSCLCSCDPGRSYLPALFAAAGGAIAAAISRAIGAVAALVGATGRAAAILRGKLRGLGKCGDCENDSNCENCEHALHEKSPLTLKLRGCAAGGTRAGGLFSNRERQEQD
jgi:hypothetical protein